MTIHEKKLLTELKEYFVNEFGSLWEREFNTYVSKIVNDNHIEQYVVDEFLKDTEPNKILENFLNSSNKKTPTPTITNTQTYHDSYGHTVYRSSC